MISSPAKLRRSARVAGTPAPRFLHNSTDQGAAARSSTHKAHASRQKASKVNVPEPTEQGSLKSAPGLPSRSLELSVWAQGFKHVAGVDEAGRGPLAGPVVAGACILPSHVDIPGIKDSKLMTHLQREQVYALLVAHPEVTCATCVVDVADIDEMNILQAALKAMEGAVAALPHTPPDYLLVDGNQLPRGLNRECSQTVVRGDSKSTVIAAASVLAKVTRDKLMDQYHEQWPQYNFAQHKGYGTRAHMAALKELGPCPIHRRSFAPLKHWLEAGTMSANTNKEELE